MVNRGMTAKYTMEVAEIKNTLTHLVSSIKYPLSGVFRFASCILHPASCILYLVVFLWMIPLQADVSYGDEIDTIVARIQLTYDAVKDFRAQFVQESMVKSWQAAQVQKAEGVVYFKKGGKMCWEYQHPISQKIISNGKKLWFYEPEDKQVTVGEVGKGLQSQISADLLNGKANLTRDFEVKLVTSMEDDYQGKLVLELTPKVSQSNLTRVMLKLDKSNFHIYQTEVYDLFDNITRITFSQIAMNTSLPDALFTFTPPKGVEILTPPSLSLPH